MQNRSRYAVQCPVAITLDSFGYQKTSESAIILHRCAKKRLCSTTRSIHASLSMYKYTIRTDNLSHRFIPVHRHQYLFLHEGGNNIYLDPIGSWRLRAETRQKCHRESKLGRRFDLCLLLLSRTTVCLHIDTKRELTHCWPRTDISLLLCPKGFSVIFTNSLCTSISIHAAGQISHYPFTYFIIGKNWYRPTFVS